MARETQRQKTERAEAPLDRAPPVRIEEQRRFFSNNGNDRAVREARALKEAFGIGTQFVGAQIDRANVAGRERATEQAGAGGIRDVNDKNAAYHRAWDALDDERSLQFAKKALPELLRGADAENLPEVERQKLVTQFMHEQFAGIDLENEDHTILAKGLLQLETDTIAGYRDSDLAKIKEGQRTETYAAELENYRETGLVRYDVLAERTNTFLDGDEKMIAYWESIYDLARETGDVSIIDNVPERFPGGDPTGINDPLRQKEHDAARSAAVAVAVKRDKAELDALEAHKEAVAESTKLRIYMAQADGLDVDHMVDEAVVNGHIEVSDALTFDSALSGQLGRRMDASEQSSTFAQLNYRIIAEPGSVSYDTISRAYQAGVFGDTESPEARAKYRTALNDLESSKGAAASRSKENPMIDARRDEMKAIMEPKKDELGFARSNLEVNLQAEMLRRFDEKVATAKDPAALQMELLNEYQTRVKSVRDHFDNFADNAPNAAVTFSNSGMNEQQFVQQYRTRGWKIGDLDSLEQSNPVAYKRAITALYKSK